MRHTIKRRHWLTQLGATGIGMLAPLHAFAQESYPARGPVKVFVPLPAGGAADVTARVVVASLQTQLKQTFIVENRPGASFAIGMQALAQAPADGYTLLHINNGMCAAQAALKKIDMLATLAPISLMGTTTTVLSVPASSSFKSLKDLLAAKPGSLNYGSVGLGSLQHLWCSQFSKRHGLDAVHVPFRGAPEAATALAGGEIQFMPLNLPLAMPLIQRGQVRPLALTDIQRHPALPDVATTRELGDDAPPLVFWGGFAARRGTPAATVAVLRTAIATALAQTEVATRLLALSTTPVGSDSPASFEGVIERELAWMGEAVKNANLQLN